MKPADHTRLHCALFNTAVSSISTASCEHAVYSSSCLMFCELGIPVEKQWIVGTCQGATTAAAAAVSLLMTGPA